MKPTDEEVQETLKTKVIEEYDLDNCEYYFLIDRSESMSGMTIQLAVQALKLFIQSLPYGCKFNIVSFGSSYQFMYPESVEYNDKSLEESLRIIEDFDADMGSTEILEPMLKIFEILKISELNR